MQAGTVSRLLFCRRSWGLKIHFWRKISEARNEERKVHFASSMDLCHLKNSELEPKFQKYKGRVVLRGDIVKDDSGSYAVFTQGPLVSHSKSNGCQSRTTRMRRTSSRRNNSLHPGQNGRCTKINENSQIRTSRYLDIHQHMNVKNNVPAWKAQLSLLNKICMVIFWQDYCGKGNWRKFFWKTVGEKFQIGNVYSWTEKKGLFLSVCGRYKTGWKET